MPTFDCSWRKSASCPNPVLVALDRPVAALATIVVSLCFYGVYGRVWARRRSALQVLEIPQFDGSAG